MIRGDAVQNDGDIGVRSPVNFEIAASVWLTAWDASRSRSERDDRRHRAAPESGVSCGP